MTDFAAFMRESNRIEGILRDPTPEEIAATEEFVALRKIGVDDLVRLVGVYQPNAVLRDKSGRNVRVGKHIPPPGGPFVRSWLELILLDANDRVKTPHQVHIDYETLHPFTDGNGRSGRAVWLWMMREAPLNFLHHFYYQTLQASNSRDAAH